MKKLITALCLLFAMSTLAIAAGKPITTLRKAPLAETETAPRMTPQSNDDIRKVRNYPEQPPVIPHKIEDYQLNVRVNQCMECHSRTAIGDSQAPMVSVTHFMDRDGQFLASISARRYFCTQCHVPQHEAKPLVENEFVDADTLIEYLSKKKDQ